jgi:hypothetical protein
MPTSRQLELRAFIERWNKDYIKGSELLAALRRAHQDCTDDDVRVALGSVARDGPSATSAHAAAALCELAGIGDPLDTAMHLYNKSAAQLTEPQWFAWIAGYSYNWICNAGLRSCYSDFGDEQFADRIRVYDAIGATTAASVMREADRAWGVDGPPANACDRAAAWTDAIRSRLEALSPRFWACGDEIFTRVLLYTLENAEDFKLPR